LEVVWVAGDEAGKKHAADTSAIVGREVEACRHDRPHAERLQLAFFVLHFEEGEAVGVHRQGPVARIQSAEKILVNELPKQPVIHIGLEAADAWMRAMIEEHLHEVALTHEPLDSLGEREEAEDSLWLLAFIKPRIVAAWAPNAHIVTLTRVDIVTRVTHVIRHHVTNK
jgi:hypothetical protein